MNVVEWGRFIAPANASAALDYLKRNLLSIHGRRSRLSAIAGKVPLTGRMTEIDGHPALGLARPFAPAGGSQWIILRDYAGLRQRNLVFLFDAGGRMTRVIKTRPVDAPGQSLRVEADALRAIREQVDADLQRTMPEVLAFVISGSHEVMALSALPGRPLDISMQRSLRPRVSHRSHLAAAGTWLGRLHAATRNGPQTAVHGDFWTRNLLFAGTDLLGVVDWEGALPAGERWDDLFTLPLLYATAAPVWFRREPLRDFEAAFTGRGGVATAVSGYFAAYSAQTGIDQRAIRGAFESYLAEQESRGKHEETQWKTRYSWKTMLRIVQSSRNSIFSASA